MLFLGDDWAEAHHDIELQDGQGRVLARRRLLEGVGRCFGQHPDAEIFTSQPGLGVIPGARVLAEFGDDKDRFAEAKARRNYAGTSPITKASGTRRVVLARYARNKRLADALCPPGESQGREDPGGRSAFETRHNQKLNS